MSQQNEPQTDGGAVDQGNAWFLEAFGQDDASVLKRVSIRPLPFRVGRDPHLPLVLNLRNISRTHAEIFLDRGKLMVRDLDSTNGTFVNQKLVLEPHELHEGDIVNFAESEFRVGREQQSESDAMSKTQDVGPRLPRGMLATMKDFADMLRSESVSPLYQPIVRMDSLERFAYEVLGRGTFPGLVRTPRELFAVASMVHMEVELSRLFLKTGVELGALLSENAALFLNIHKSEMRDTHNLIAWLKQTFGSDGGIRATLEIHEAAVASVHDMRELRGALTDLGFGLAYDDFGSGQARLLELVEVPPDWVKFDISLIQKLHSAPRKRQEMVETLVRMAHDMGVSCIAEGVETQQEAEACAQAGFVYAQGFYYGQPFTLSGDSATQTDS